MRNRSAKSPSSRSGNAELRGNGSNIAGYLVSNIRDEVVKSVEHYFHASSNTHIVYCMTFGRRGLKACADYADEAMEKFTVQLDTILSDASSSELETWHSKIVEYGFIRNKEHQIQETAKRPGMGEYSLTLLPVHNNAIDVLADNRSRNAVIEELLRAGLRRVQEIIDSTRYEEFRAQVTTVDRHQRNASQERSTRTVRVDTDLHARLQIAAHEVGVQMSQLCRFVVLEELGARGLIASDARIGKRRASEHFGRSRG